MKQALLLAPLAALFALPARAQQASPKFEIYGGYSYMLIKSASSGSKLSSSGWEVAANWNLSPKFGITADFDGNYCCSGQYLYTYLIGPQFTTRRDRYSVFLHALVGGASAQGLTETGSALAWALGAGVDWNVNPRIALRLPQVDWLGTRFLSGTQSDLRISAGVVFKLDVR